MIVCESQVSSPARRVRGEEAVGEVRGDVERRGRDRK